MKDLASEFQTANKTGFGEDFQNKGDFLDCEGFPYDGEQDSREDFPYDGEPDSREGFPYDGKPDSREGFPYDGEPDSQKVRINLKPGEQLDKLLNGRLIIQDRERFMFGIDAVLLADFAVPEVRFNDSVVDLGTGTGIIPLLMEAAVSKLAAERSANSVNGANKKKAEAHFTALEIQPESAEMATRSVAANGLSQKINVVEGDIKNVSQLFPPHSFNVVTTNPPYMINNHGRQNENDAKTIARHEILCNLEDIIAAADYLLRPHGKFFMIHRPFRLPEIFAAMNAHKIEPKRMRLVQPTPDKEPNIVMIEGRKNANPRLKIEPTLSVYQEPGLYSQEVQEIYKKQNIK